MRFFIRQGINEGSFFFKYELYFYWKFLTDGFFENVDVPKIKFKRVVFELLNFVILTFDLDPTQS